MVWIYLFHIIRSYFNRLSYWVFFCFVSFFCEVGPTVYIQVVSSPPFVWSQQTSQFVISPCFSGESVFFFLLKSPGQTTAYMQTDQTSRHTMATAEQKPHRQYSVMSQVWCWDDCGRVETNSPSGHLRSRWNVVIGRHSHCLSHPSLLSHTLRRKTASARPTNHFRMAIFSAVNCFWYTKCLYSSSDSVCCAKTTTV